MSDFPISFIPVISVRTEVGVTLEQARDWFLSLREHPERYRFATHEGFVFTEGDFGRPGARFYTVERLGGLRRRLEFMLSAVGDTWFEFTLLKPLNGQVVGVFLLSPGDSATTTLALRVGARTAWGAHLLRFAPIRIAVTRQIAAEIRHIKASMVALYA